MTTITLNTTPQAQDDLYTVAMFDGVISEDGGTITLSVMANDLGGKAKTLFSLDDGAENEGSATSADLLTRDIVGADNFSKSGALIEFTSDGTVSYTMTAASTAKFQSLAEGEIGVDTFTYAIRLGNGTLSSATVTVEIRGTNDVPVITSMTQSGSVNEDGALTASGRVTSTDVDNGATATYSGNAAGAYGSFAIDAVTGEWTYTLDNDAAQSLTADQTITETYTVTVTDDKGAKVTQDVTVSITGKDEAPVAVNEVVEWRVSKNMSDAELVFTGFDSNDTLKPTGNLDYIGFEEINADTVVTFEYQDKRTTDTLEVTLVGYSDFTEAQIIGI